MNDSFISPFQYIHIYFPTDTGKHQAIIRSKILATKRVIRYCRDHRKSTSNAPVQTANPEQEDVFSPKRSKSKSGNKETEENQHPTH